MAGEYDTLYGEVETTIATMIRRVYQKHTWSGSWSKLVWRRWEKIRVTQASKNLENGI